MGSTTRDDDDDDDDGKRRKKKKKKKKKKDVDGVDVAKERKKAERFYQVMLKEAQKRVNALEETTTNHHGVVAEEKETPGKRSARRKEELDLSACEEIPLWVRNRAPETFCLLTTRIAVEETSGDGSTTKIIVELQDGHRVEAVIIRHLKGRRAEGKKGLGATLCISSQVGCKMGCTFCATGTLSLIHI